MFVACGIWCLADVSSVSPSSEQTLFFFMSMVKRNLLLPGKLNCFKMFSA